MSNFKNLKNNLKPREKFLLYGSNTLSQTEFLSIILGTGYKNKSVLQTSQELIEKYGDLNGLLKQDVNELKSNKGIGDAKAVKLKTVYSIHLELLSANSITEKSLLSSEDLYKLVKKYSKNIEENVYVICLDNQRKLISCKHLFKGNINSVMVSPREIFKIALGENSNKMCLVHNHPSGDLHPSKGDIRVTKALIEVAAGINIELIDHLIISKNGYFSFRNKLNYMF